MAFMKIRVKDSRTYIDSTERTLLVNWLLNEAQYLSTTERMVLECDLDLILRTLKRRYSRRKREVNNA